VASQWNSDKIFNVVGHYAAAKQNFITVIATEIDYEDINKPPSTNLSNSDFSNPQSDLINKFYSSLNSNNQPLITSSNNTNNVKLENNPTPVTPFETTNLSTSTTPTIPIASTSSIPTQNSLFNISQPQCYQPNPMCSPNSQLITNNPYSTQTPYNNLIVIEDVSAQQSTQKTKRSYNKSKNKAKELPLKKVKTRSDTKNNQNLSPTGIMDLAVTNLFSQESQSANNEDEEDESNSTYDDDEQV
jgi:hypothetical protein